MFIFDERLLEAVDARAALVGHDFSKQQCKLLGKGIDDMNEEEKNESFLHGFGGSTVPTIMGYGHDKAAGPNLLFDRIITKALQKFSKSTLRIFDLGHFKERQFFDILRENLPDGWKLELLKDRYVDVDKPYLYIDIDGMLVAPWGEKFIVEIKSAKRIQNRPDPTDGVVGENGYEAAVLTNVGYEWQTRYYMREFNTRAAVIVTGYFDAVDFDELKFATVYRDFEKEDRMYETITDFWENHVEKGIRPEYVTMTSEELASASRVIKSPDPVKDNRVEVNERAAELAQEYLELKEQNTELNKVVDENKDRMNGISSELLGIIPKDALGYDKSNKYWIKNELKAKGRASFDTAKFKLEHYDLWEEYQKKPEELLYTISISYQKPKDKKTKKAS